MLFADSPATIVCWAMGLTQQRDSVADDPRDRQRPAAARHARPAGGGPVPGARSLQRAGRPHHGHRGAPTGLGAAGWASCSGSPCPPDAGLRHGRRHPGHAGRPGDGVPRAGRQLRRGHARHRGDRGRAARLRADRAHLDQAQPLPRACPAPSRCILPCLGRTERDVQASGEQFVTVEDSMSFVHASRGRLDAGLAAAALRGGDRGPARAGAAGRRPCRGPSSRPTTARSGSGSPPSCPASTGSRRRSARRRVHAAARPARRADLPDAVGAGPVHRQPAVGPSTCRPGACCCRRCAATTSTTPRSTGSTTATVASTVDAAWSSSTRTTWPPLGVADGSMVDLVSEWADGVRPAGHRVPGGGLPDARGLRRHLLPRGERARAAGLDGRGSQTPTSKQIIVRLEPATSR